MHVFWGQIVGDCRSGSRWSWKQQWAGSFWRRHQKGCGGIKGSKLRVKISALLCPEVPRLHHKNTHKATWSLTVDTCACMSMHLGMKRLRSKEGKMSVPENHDGAVAHKTWSTTLATVPLQRWHFTISLCKHSSLWQTELKTQRRTCTQQPATAHKRPPAPLTLSRQVIVNIRPVLIFDKGYCKCRLYDTLINVKETAKSKRCRFGFN